MQIFLVLVIVTEFCLGQLPAGKIFEQNCVACHQLENKKEPIVGPSLVEIAHIYNKDLAGFVKWCNSPQKKRKDAIEMPSMAHVGNDNLKKIHSWILNETKGKKFVIEKEKKGDPYALSISEASQPRLQRIFMPDSSPASIAVTIDGQHSLCWDTLACRMRYIWKGGFIDGFDYWKGNGNAFASVIGDIYYRAPMKLSSGLASESLDDAPKFKGYKMVDGLPVFSYSLGSHEVTEAILNQSGILVIQVKIKNVEDEVRYPLGDLEKTEFNYSAGKIENGALVLTAKEAANFKLSFSPKK
jgi:cytochrome c551/c552